MAVSRRKGGPRSCFRRSCTTSAGSIAAFACFFAIASARQSRYRSMQYSHYSAGAGGRGRHAHVTTTMADAVLQPNADDTRKVAKNDGCSPSAGDFRAALRAGFGYEYWIWVKQHL